MTYIKLADLLSEAHLDWKEIPEEDQREALELIKRHNDNSQIQQDIKGHYAIDVTGKHQVYYTFWRFKEIDPRFAAFIKNPIYMGNLTTDFLSSVKKALEKMPPTTKLTLYSDETRQHLIGKTEVFTFGKYRGKPYYEVYMENPGYFAFLAKNADPKYAASKANVIIQQFAEMYYEEQTKKNQETSTSKFVGTVGEKISAELKIYRLEEKQGTDFNTGQPKMYKVYKMTDAEGNKFVAFDLDKYFPQAQKDDTIKVQAKIKDHKELMGIKFTALNYVRPA